PRRRSKARSSHIPRCSYRRRPRTTSTRRTLGHPAPSVRSARTATARRRRLRMASNAPGTDRNERKAGLAPAFSFLGAAPRRQPLDFVAVATKRANGYLIGPMGSGKTAVGKRLAALLGKEFVDSDAEIERRCGVDIRYIFEKE